MSTDLDESLRIDHDLAARLRRVGSEFETPPAHVRPAAAAVEAAGSRWWRGLLGLVVAGALTTGAIAATRPSGTDPVVGVIPKNLKTTDIRWFTYSERAATPTRSYSELLVVDGADVLLSLSTDPPLAPKSKTPTIISGAAIYITSAPAGATPLTDASWENRANSHITITVARNREQTLPIVERLVPFTATIGPSAQPMSFPGMERIARWDTSSSSRISATVRTSQAVNAPSEDLDFFSLSTAMPASILGRVDAIRDVRPRPLRFGDFAVSSEAPIGEVRFVRRSEAQRIQRQVDRRRAAEMTGRWTDLGSGLSANTTSVGICIRTDAEAACGRNIVNRRIGNHWVFALFTGDGDQRWTTKGRNLRPIAVGGVRSATAFVVPVGVDSISVDYPPELGGGTSAIVRRPTH